MDIAEASSQKSVDMRSFAKAYALKVGILHTSGDGVATDEQLSEMYRLFPQFIEGMIFPRFMPPGRASYRAGVEIRKIVSSVIRENVRKEEDTMKSLLEHDSKLTTFLSPGRVTITRTTINLISTRVMIMLIVT